MRSPGGTFVPGRTQRRHCSTRRPVVCQRRAAGSCSAEVSWPRAREERVPGLVSPLGEEASVIRTLLIDNADSFTLNLFHLLAEVIAGDPVLVLGVCLRLEQLRGVALGFRNRSNCPIRSLLHAGGLAALLQPSL